MTRKYNHKDDCIFCKISSKKIPSNIIYEDEDVIAFLDIANDVYGHTLVIPKNHFENVFEIDDINYQKLMNVVKLIANHYKRNCNFDGVNIISNNDKSSGQEVFHIHYHIYPRINNDNLKLLNTLDKNDFDLKEVANKLKIY